MQCLNVFQLVLVHAEVMSQLVDDGQADLLADFRLAGTDGFNIFLIEGDAIGTARQVKDAFLRPGYPLE
jgi:hypothetical protein